MSEIKVYGTLVDETVENKVAYANQVYHVRKEKDVATLLDELTDTVAQIPAPTEQNYKGRITITDLLAISDSNKGENDLYLVYSSGNDEDGWSNDSTFNLNGIDYPDETFVQWVSGEWRAISDEDANTYKALVFDQPQDKVSLIYSTYGESSYDHLYGRWRDGLKIADVYNYTLDKEEGVYKPDYEVQEGRYGGKTNIKTIVIPWCRSYASGLSGMTRNYTGGLLKDGDYERLMESARVFVLDSEKTTSVTTIDTNGTAPYNSSYGTTELVVNNNNVALEIREGFLLSITNKQLSIDQDHRNVRIKFTSATNTLDPIPLFDVDGTILDGYKEIQPGKTTNLFQYRIGMSTGNGFYKILTEGNIKEIRLNGQSVENEDGIINLEVDSTSSKSLQTRAPMSTNSWNTIVTNTVGANPADTFENTIWEEVGYFTTTGITEDVIKSIVLSVRGERDSDIFSTVGCQVNLGYSNNEFTVNSLGCTVDNPELDKLFALGYNKVTERLSLFVRRKNAAQRVYLFCISSEMIFTQSSDTSWYSYSNLVTLCDGNNQNNPGLKLSSYSGQFSISIGSNIYNVDSDGNIDLGAFPDHHLKSNFSQYTGWSEVGYASYDDFYNFKKSIIFSISERSQLSSGVTSTNVQDNCSGILKISLFGTTNYNNYRFDSMSCTVDNSRLVDKIRLTYDKNAASDKNIKLYVKCDFPYQEWLLQDLSGNSPFIRTEHESGSNDYIANVTKPTTGQIVSSTFDGGGTITEVQLNGNTVSTSGVANIQALPLSYFYSSSNNGTVYTNQWREIAYFIVEDVNSTLSFSQIFSVRERLGTLDKHSGILTFGMRVDHGSVTHLVCNVDNPNLDGLFKAVYNNTTGRCSIFGKTIGGWNSWGLTTISNANHFHQGLDALTAEPTSISSGMITAATCYSSGGEGTITEVQLYGNTVSTSGVANIIPQTKMSTVGNGYGTKWKEISNYVNIPVSTTYLETFVAQTLSSSAECRGGIVTVEIKTTSSGTIDTLRCYTDNPVLTNYFRVTYDNATRICRIYSGSYSSWNLVGISGESKFVQSSTATSTSSSTYRTLSEITPSSGTIVTPVSYTADSEFSQVQANWNTTTTTDPSYIVGKPDIITNWDSATSDVKLVGARLLKDTFRTTVKTTGDQYIDGEKTFEKPLTVENTNGNNKLIDFRIQENGYEYLVGGLGVDYSTTNYSALTNSLLFNTGGAVQKSWKVVLLDSAGDSTHPIYIDENGRTKQCTINVPEYNYKVFSFALGISYGTGEEFTLGNLTGDSLPHGVTLTAGREAYSQLSLNLRSTGDQVNLNSVMLTAGSQMQNYEVAIINESHQNLNSGHISFRMILRSRDTGAKVRSNDLAQNTEYTLYFHLGMMCK